MLPIGGLKEKTLAAKRAGIKQVIVPKRNRKDMPDIPDEVQAIAQVSFRGQHRPGAEAGIERIGPKGNRRQTPETVGGGEIQIIVRVTFNSINQ